MRYKRTYILINFCLDDEDLVEQRVTRKRQKIHSDTDNSGIDCKQNIKGGYTTIFSALSYSTFIYIVIAILDFSLLLPIKLSLFQLLR